MKHYLLILIFALAPISNLWALFDSAISDRFRVGKLWYFISSDKATVIPESTNPLTNYQGLKFVVIPDSISFRGVSYPVCTIAPGAFRGCKSITSVTIPETITKIGVGAFDRCKSIKSIVWNAKNCIDFCTECLYESDIEYYSKKKQLYRIEAIKAAKVEMYDGKKKSASCIMQYSYNDVLYSPFYYSRNSISSVVFGDKVESIPAALCFEFKHLTSVTIPASVKRIGLDAFWGCDNITHMNYTGDIASWCDIRFEHLFANPTVYTHNLIINNQIVTDLVIPNGVDTIFSYAFAQCDSLKSITIPESVTAIAIEAFLWSNAITSINYNAINAKWIEMERYYPYNNYYRYIEVSPWGWYINRDSITSIVFGDKVKWIPQGICRNFTQITSVTIPASVTHIGNQAFDFCSQLRTIICKPTTPPVTATFCFELLDSTTLYVPTEAMEAYKKSEIHVCLQSTDYSDFLGIPPPEFEPFEITTESSIPNPWSCFKTILPIEE